MRNNQSRASMLKRKSERISSILEDKDQYRKGEEFCINICKKLSIKGDFRV